MRVQDQRGAQASSRRANCPARRRGDVGSAVSWLLARARPTRHVTARPRVRAAGARARERARRRGTGLGRREVRGRGRGSARRPGKFPGSSARRGAGRGGRTMNVFRILGDLSHLLAMFLLLVKIWRSKSCAGERRPGGAGRDLGGDSGSKGTTRASKNFSQVVRRQRIREIMRERGFRLHGHGYRTSVAPSFTPPQAGNVTATGRGLGGGGWRPSPSLGGKSSYLEAALVLESFPPLSPAFRSPGRTFLFLHASDTSLAQGCGALSGNGRYWRGSLFGQRSGRFAGVGRSFHVGFRL